MPSWLSWMTSSGLNPATEQIARETIRQSLPWVLVIAGGAICVGAVIHILFLEPGLRVYVLPTHLIFLSVGVYWLYHPPQKLNQSVAVVGFYLSSVLGFYLMFDQIDTSLHFGILVVGALYLALDRRLLLVFAALFLGWCLWLAVFGHVDSSFLVTFFISASGGLAFRYQRLTSIRRLVVVQQALEQAMESREQALQRVREAEKMESLGVMAAGVAHDYNNLLVGVVGGLDLATKAISDEALREAHGTIRSSVNSLIGLSRELMDVAGGRPIDKRKLPLNEVVYRTLERTVADFGRQERVGFEPAPNLPEVMGEAMSIERLTMNLVLNAMHYASQRPGAISVGTQDASDQNTCLVKLWVEDDGPGIPDPIKGRIFDPFFSTKEAGRGLGLATVRAIVERHHGSIEISHPRNGVRFEILLPACDPAD